MGETKFSHNENLVFRQPHLQIWLLILRESNLIWTTIQAAGDRGLKAGPGKIFFLLKFVLACPQE